MSLKRDNIRELEDYIDPANAEKDCLKVIAKVKPSWNLEEVKFKPCPSAGFINTMLICYTEEEADDWIIFRIFGLGLDFMLDHKSEIAATKTLHMAGISPYVHCIFKNGICMEFIKGKAHTWADLSDWKDVKKFKSVARELARLHSQEVRDIAIQCGFDPKDAQKRREDKIPKIEPSWPTEMREKEADELFRSAIPPFSTYKAEIGEMEQVFREQFPTMTFVHGEANPTNIVYVEKADRAVLVDYDFSELGYLTFDLAVFIEFSAVGMTPDVDGTLRHSDEYIKVFLREYLETKRNLGEMEHDVSDTDVERLFVQTMKAVLAVYLSYSFGFIQVASGRDGRHGVRQKDLVGLSCLLYGWYTKHKEQILAMKEPPL